MTTVQFTGSQVTHLNRFFSECGDSIMDYLIQNIEEGGVEPSELKDKIKTILNTEDFTLSDMDSKSLKTKSKKKAKAKASIKEDSDEEVEVDKIPEKKTKVKAQSVAKKTKTKKKGSSGPTGHRLYMFGIKDFEAFPGGIVEFKGSDEVEEWGQDKSSGEIHKHCFSLASKAWKDAKQDEWKALAEEVKASWAESMEGDDDEDKKFAWEDFTEEQKQEFADKADKI